MMKIHISLLLLFAILLFIGCEEKFAPEKESKTEHEAENSIHNVTVGDVEIIIIDGCEYIIYKERNGNNQGYGYMAHKGNCKNPIHIYNKIDLKKQNETE